MHRAHGVNQRTACFLTIGALRQRGRNDPALPSQQESISPFDVIDTSVPPQKSKYRFCRVAGICCAPCASIVAQSVSAEKAASMLILTRRVGETITVGNDVRITVILVKGDKVRVGVDAPKDVGVYREEVYAEIRKAAEVAHPGG